MAIFTWTALESDRQPHDRFLARRGALEHAGDLAVMHDHDPVAHAQDLGHLRRDHEDREAVLLEPVHEVVDLLLRAHIHAAGGLIEDQHLRRGDQPLGDRDLLLVPAGQEPHLLVLVRGLDRQRLHVPARRPRRLPI